MREGTGAGRGERARIARRVQAVVGGGLPSGRAATPQDGPGDPPGEGIGVRQVLAGRMQALLVRYTGVRIAPGPRAAAAVGAVALVAALATLCWVIAARPHAVPVREAGGSRQPTPAALTSAPGAESPGSTTTRATPTPPAPSPAPGKVAAVVVDVAGKVRHPGIYRLPAGSRIDDAITAAGGALPGVDLSSVNLAAVVHDGEQVAVGVPGAGPGAAGGGDPASGAASGGPAGPVYLNSASLSQLETLPGVGPVLAQRIVDWRTAHGGFTRVGQLREVSGIGPAKFATLQKLVRV